MRINTIALFLLRDQCLENRPFVLGNTSILYTIPLFRVNCSLQFPRLKK
jgi:hypothetical protein